jgi:hypothetical protein
MSVQIAAVYYKTPRLAAAASTGSTPPKHDETTQLR